MREKILKMIHEKPGATFVEFLKIEGFAGGLGRFLDDL